MEKSMVAPIDRLEPGTDTAPLIVTFTPASRYTQRVMLLAGGISKASLSTNSESGSFTVKVVHLETGIVAKLANAMPKITATIPKARGVFLIVDLLIACYNFS
jgi:hypothetical protein